MRPAAWPLVAASPVELASVLVVEDDAELASVIRDAFTSVGYSVYMAASGAEARSLFDRLGPSLVVLDLLLPDTDGLVLTASLKSHKPVPIIVLSAHSQPSDRVLALKLGADDFIAKPFELDELLARVEAVLRRPHTSAPPRDDDRISIGELTIVHSRRLVTLGPTPIRLTPTEYRLLHTLARRANQVVPYALLVEQVWGYSGITLGHLIDTHMWRLRAKLRVAGARGAHITTVRGHGFALVSDGVAPPHE